MKKIFTLISCFVLTFSSGYQLYAQQVYKYNFRNNFNEENAAGPALNVLGTGSFATSSLNELSCLQRTVYNFDQNGGVQFDNGAAGNFINQSYTLELYFQFLSNTGFRRMIDFKNRTSDFGLYSTSTQLQFYDPLTLNTTSFTASQFVHFVITRDSATQEVVLFIDGITAGSFIDSTGLGLMDNDNVINFFQDDLVFGGEAQPGTLALLNVYNIALDAVQIASNFAELETTSSVVAFNADNNSACIDSNNFVFTNNSQNSSALTYTWDFGDTTTSTGTNASHVYALPGLYTVTLIADDGAGCTDSSSIQVEVFSQPFINLGSDITICDGDSVVIDAGSGFAQYLWNDSTSLQTLTTYAPGTFSAVVTDANNCSATDSIVVDVISATAIDLGIDTTLCSGSSIVLSAPSGQTTYLWSTADTTETITVSASGIYAVEVVNSAGCVSSDTIEVSVNFPQVVSLGVDSAICDTDTLLLDAGTGFASYEWNDFTTNSTLTVTTSGNYSVTVTDLFGCTATDSISVSVNPIPVIDLGSDGFFCGGSPFALDAGAGFSTYLWNDGTGNQTLNITTAGAYSVVVTDTNGCSGTDSIIIGINPSVSLGLDINLCIGDSATLDAGAGFSSYVWSTGVSSQTISVTSDGTYTVTVTDGNGCVNFDEISVAFLPSPDVNIGPDLNFCGGTSALLDAGPGFTTYLWSDNSTSQSIVVSQSGIYIVTVSNLGGCTDVDSIVVNVSATPFVNLGNDTTLCDGASLILDAGAGFVSYQWIGGSSQQTITVNSTNNYFVVVTDANGCSGSDDIDVIFNAPVPLPVITLGTNILYSSSPTGNQWYSNPGGLIPGATDTSYAPPQNGTYYVIVTDANGCSSLPSLDFIFVIDNIFETEENLFTIYPNPANEELVIVSDINSFTNVNIEVMDILGQVVLQSKLETSSGQKLNVSSLSEGSYFVRLTSNTKSIVKQFIISR